jgi:hypothetical protein
MKGNPMKMKMKQMLVSAIVVGVLKGVGTVMVNTHKELSEIKRREGIFIKATTLYENLGDEPSDEKIKEYLDVITQL